MTCKRAPLPDQGVFYIVHVCAACGKHNDGDEVMVREPAGWLSYHRACAPDPEKFQKADRPL